MREKFLQLYCCIFALTLTITACAQPSTHVSNQKWVSNIREAELATVLLNNQPAIIPLRDLQSKKVASVNLSASFNTVFDSILNKYAKADVFSALSFNASPVQLNLLNGDLKFYNTIIVQVTDAGLNNPAIMSFIKDMEKNRQLILVLNGNVSSLANLDSINSPIIWSAKESAEQAQVSAQLIFGGLAASGKLKQSASLKYKQGDGFVTSANRLNYAVPESVEINSDNLIRPIDAIVEDAINKKATPGAVVLVAKDGKVIFNKAYGYYTYDNQRADSIDDIFDLASVTKISATTMATMRLYEQEKIKLDTNVGAYIPEARSTNKNDIRVRELLLHQAGLVPYIPFYESIKPGEYSRDSSEMYPVKVADNYYLRKGYFEDIMWPQMVKSHLESRGKYVYSDLSMYFMKEIVERQAIQPLAQYVSEQFYQPLGMKTAGFNPRYRFPREKIVPTENDTYFRKTLLQGFVHDQGAAMVGGVSGHAGLFASANDLAILFQMILNGGSYGGMQYFKPETVKLFTSKQSNVSRRGLGFDRWDPETGTYPSSLASSQTFGHTGFTGTCVWVDPKYNLVYIFLSNRVQTPGANKLQSMNIRAKVQDAVYKAINKAGIIEKE
ncbi:serine hydrolase domain-containing protein [Rubrolithibacter danxiaensis]|uniref:serine hydrolase domain-containing protein n=1 Tax=Rubrolithibacter danxiaensis TaxID=3390805 RepID=UPI003BF77796